MTDELKSAVELALEKLDREMQNDLPQLNDDQKKHISEIRSKFQAKIAELEISTQSTIRKARQSGDFSTVGEAEARLSSERQRLERMRDQEIEQVRRDH
jgi:hypothetical protein